MVSSGILSEAKPLTASCGNSDRVSSSTNQHETIVSNTSLSQTHAPQPKLLLVVVCCTVVKMALARNAP